MISLKLLVKKTLLTILLIFLVASGLFFFFRLMPGSFVDYVAISGAGPEELNELERKWGLDQPLYIQYFVYISNLLVGDMGESFRLGRGVWEVVFPRLMNSFILIAPAIVCSYLLGSIYGAAMGLKRGSVFERYGIIPVTIFGTIPEFFLAIILIITLGVNLDFLPVSGIASRETLIALNDEPFWAIYFTTDFLQHYILPFLTITLLYLYLSSLVMRTSVVEVSGQEFAYYHRMKGLPRSRQARHIMKHASLPVITLFPSTMTRSIGGMVLIEVVFDWPGIGLLLIESVLFRDFPVVQFVFFLIAVWVILGNYIIDILYGIIDPRISIESSD